MTKSVAQYQQILKRLKDEMASELRNDILKYWIDNVTDKENGGYIGRITNSDERDVKAEKAVVLNTRLLWTFSAAYRVLGDEIYLHHAERAYDYLEQYFYDEENGGFFWSVDHKGELLEDKKHVYAQAFAIYGYSEFARASGLKSALNRAMETFRLLETRARDQQNEGYNEGFTRDWKPLEDVRLGEGDANEQRSMNTHLHVMEAYSNLYRVNSLPGIKQNLEASVQLMLGKIRDPENNHFYTFFDEKWNPKSEVYSYGHDIEAAWLLIEAAEALEDPELIRRTKETARDISETTLDEGVDRETGGMYNTGMNGQLLDKDYHWWVQAEAIVGFLYVYEITKNPDYLTAAADLWSFIKKSIKDVHNGEWFFRVNEEGTPYMAEDKIGPWKCPYHNARACLIMIERFGARSNVTENGSGRVEKTASDHSWKNT